MADHLKAFFLADANDANAVGVSSKLAEREAIRIDDKVHANAHFWLTVLPTDPMLTLCWYDAQDYMSWYFGVPLRERESDSGFRYCLHQKPASADKDDFLKIPCGNGYQNSDDHIFACQ